MNEAASQAEISRSTIYRLVHEGKLSATTDRRGKKVIELSEFIRVFGEPKKTKEQNKTSDRKDKKNISGHSHETNFSHLGQELEQLRNQLQMKDLELKLKDKELAWMNSRVEELREAHAQVIEEKNKFLQIIERQTLLLTNSSTPKPATTAIKKTIAPITTKEQKTPAKSTVKKAAEIKKASSEKLEKKAAKKRK